MVVFVMFVVSLDWVFSILRGVLWVFEEPSGVCHRCWSSVAEAAAAVLVVVGLALKEVWAHPRSPRRHSQVFLGENVVSPWHGGAPRGWLQALVFPSCPS